VEPDVGAGRAGRGRQHGVPGGAITLGGIIVLRADAPKLYAGLTGRALPVVIVSALAGIVSLALLVLRRYILARVTAALAVTAVLWGWALAQYPVLLPPDVTVGRAAAESPVLHATLASVIVGMALVVPSLLWLFFIFQRTPPDRA
jgi:cytochrome d ubiquinol oxidase subunit II